MIKGQNHTLAALGGALATAMAGAVPASAQTLKTTASVDATMTVFTAPCAVTGSDVNLGTFSDSQRQSDLAARYGAVDSNRVITAGSAPLTTLASINCPVSVPYTASIIGGSIAVPNSNFIDLNPVSGPAVPDPVVVVPVAYGIDGNLSPNGILIANGTGGIAGEGIGNWQDIKGVYSVYRPGATDPALVNGRYTSSQAMVNVDFTPQIPTCTGTSC